MSPRAFSRPPPAALEDELRRTRSALGFQLREARRARRWTSGKLAAEAGVSRWLVYLAERGESVSIEAAARIARALGRHLEIGVIDPRARRSEARAGGADLVHSAMGEVEAGHLRNLGFRVALDEPYQHYQFAGRADLVAWDLSRTSLLHVENRTRFPDFQDAAGAFNAKRAYLGRVLVDRLGIRDWASETHVMAALWSAEVVHAVRLHQQSFLAVCPDPPIGFTSWWTGGPPSRGVRSEFVMLDPLADGRQRTFVGLADSGRARPRYRGYAEVAQLLTRATQRQE